MLTDIVGVFTDNILPILLVATMGFGLQRWLKLDIQVLSKVTFNCFSPALVFSSLVNSQLAGSELAELGLFTVVAVAGMGLLGWGIAKLTRLSRRDTAALMILVMFVNGGNFGLTLNQLRYGDVGLARAAVYYVTSTFLVYTVGVFIASMGELSWRESIGKLLRLPAVYAAVSAIIVYSFQITVPSPIMSAINIAAKGAIPVMLVVLGMQMAQVNGRFHHRLAIPAITIRLLIGPLLGLGVATILGLQGLSRNAAIVESSMPAAVITIILATEFDLQPTAVTTVVVIGTLISPLTIATAITLFGL